MLLSDKPLVGVFPDGRTVGLGHSIYTSFETSNSKVATVGRDGAVIPVAPGVAKVVVKYRNSTVEVRVTVRPKPE